MNKILLLIGLISSTCFATVTIYRGNTFRVPRSCKHLALLGSTPHPTAFLSKQNYSINSLRKLPLSRFLDVDYLKESFKQALTQCTEAHIDHLLITYLPAHFYEMRAHLPAYEYERGIRYFLRSIKPQIASLITEVADELKCSFPITVVLPTKKSIQEVPSSFTSSEQRVQHYIRSFPTLSNLSKTKSLNLSIINNKGSQEQTAYIEKYLSYEYVLTAHFNFQLLELNHTKFHRYL